MKRKQVLPKGNLPGIAGRRLIDTMNRERWHLSSLPYFVAFGARLINACFAAGGSAKSRVIGAWPISGPFIGSIDFVMPEKTHAKRHSQTARKPGPVMLGNRPRAFALNSPAASGLRSLELRGRTIAEC